MPQQVRRGRPPTRDPDAIRKYYAQKGLTPPADLLAKAAQKVPTVSRTVVVGRPPKDAAPVIRQDTSDDDATVIKRIENRFELVTDFTQQALDGDLKSMVVSGAPGVGKSFNIKRVLEKARSAEEWRVKIFSGGKITPINLYMALWDTRGPRQVLLLDDADAVWWLEDSLQVLKGALDTVPDRQISWASEASALKEKDIPQTFIYRGAVIFISNYDFQTYIDTSNTKIVEHMRAVMDRTQYVDLHLHTRREVALWVTHVVMREQILKSAGLSDAQQDAVVNYIRTNSERFRSLSLRTPMQCMEYMKNPKYVNRWEEVANSILLR